MSLIKKDNSLPPRGVEAKRRKRARKRAFYLALSSLLVVVVIILTISLFFNVEKINIVGTSKYSNQEIIDATGIALRSNMFKIDKFKVIMNTEKILPYLQNVQIKRKLPTTLEVTVEEAKDAVFITTAGGFAVLSDKDKILTNVTELPELPELVGSGIVANSIGETAVFSSQITKDMYDKLYLELENIGIIKRLSKINVAKSYNMFIEIEDRLIVIIGGSEDLPRKISFLKFILEKEDTTKGYSIIDISNSNSARASVKSVTHDEYQKQLAELQK